MPHGEPGLANWTAIPAVFGTSVYAFMCHHSIPSLVRDVVTCNTVYLAMVSMSIVHF